MGDIARFKWPKGYIFINALPKSAYGTILNTDLRERLAEPGIRSSASERTQLLTLRRPAA